MFRCGTRAVLWRYVHDDAQAPKIRTAIQKVRLAAQLFGGHVLPRPREFACARPLRTLMQGQAEVGDVRVTSGIDQNISRLEIAMHELLPVQEANRLGNLDYHADHALDGCARLLAQCCRLTPSIYSCTMYGRPSAGCTS